MRILLLNQFYLPDVAATGQLLADLAEDLARKGHEVHVICSRRCYNGGGGTYARREIIRGVYVHRVRASGFGRGRAVGRMLDWLSFYLLAMVKAFRLPKMDVCVALTTPPFIALIGVMLNRLRKTRLLVWSMDMYPEVPAAFGVLSSRCRVYRFLSWLSGCIYRRCSAVISLGEFMTQRLQGAGVPAEKICTVHNWVPREA